MKIANRGAVVVGYPGIGKSTLANNNIHFIDLESSKFKRDNLDSIWYRTYCDVALDLASQGHVVFVSCHEKVRRYLSKNNHSKFIRLCCCIPSLDLENEWIEKLWKRYLDSGDPYGKDYRAWNHAMLNFRKDIIRIPRDFEYVVVIDSIDYDLHKLLQKSFNDYDFGIYTLRKL